MGRTKTYTSATVVSLVTDSPNIVQQSVLNSIIRDTEIVGDLVTNLSTGVANKLYTYYFTGRNRKPTVNLFPSSSYSLATTRILSIKAILTALHNEPVSIQHSILEPLNTDYLAYAYMAEHYGYNSLTGEFNVVPPNVDADSSSEVIFVNSYLTDGLLTILYEVPQEEGEALQFEEVTTVGNLTTSDMYYHVVYFVGSSSNVTYWNYNTSTGVHPELTTTPFGFSDDYFPVVPIMEYGKNVTEGNYQNGEVFKLSKRLLKGLQLDIENISDSLKENEQYSLMQEAYFFPSVRMRDTNQYSLKYLFHFFSVLGSNQKYNKSSFNEWKDIRVGNYGNPPTNSLQVRMRGCKFDVEWLYIGSSIVNGEWPYNDKEYARSYAKSSISSPNPNYNYSPNYNSYYNGYKTVDTSHVKFYRKISDNQYEVITITGLTLTSYIDGSYSKLWTVEDIFATGEEASEPMIIPISPSLVKQLFPKLLDRNTFIYRTYNLLLTFKKRVRLKWYQTTIFSFVMIVIAIALTVYSVGALSESMYAAYALAGGGLAGTYAALSVAFTVAFYSAVGSWAMAELIKRYGWETAGIIAAVVGVVMYAYGGFSGEFTVGDFANLGLASINDYFEEAITDVRNEIDSLLEEASKWQEAYDAMMEELFELSDSFAEMYKQYTQDKAIYYRMLPTTFMFVTLELMLHESEIITEGVSQYVDNSLKATSPDELI